MKTINKICGFVIVAFFGAALLPACSWLASFTEDGYARKTADASRYFGEPEVIGRLGSDVIRESSGLAASRCSDGVLWTHNDSGGGARVYALDLKGGDLGSWEVTGGSNFDWEDIASFRSEDGRCRLFVGDIGDNDLQRGYLSVYMFEEPSVRNGRRQDGSTAPAKEIRVMYPEGRHNAETLLVHPKTEDIYILTKVRFGESGVYRARVRDWKRTLEDGSAARMTLQASIRVPSVTGGFLTGGDISADGRRVVFCDYVGAYEFELPSGEDDFDRLWSATPKLIETGTREQGEAVAYSADGNAIYLTSEGVNSPLTRVRRKGN